MTKNGEGKRGRNPTFGQEFEALGELKRQLAANRIFEEPASPSHLVPPSMCTNPLADSNRPLYMRRLTAIHFSGVATKPAHIPRSESDPGPRRGHSNRPPVKANKIKAIRAATDFTLDLGVYRADRPCIGVSLTPIRASLHDVSADMSRLVIRAAESVAQREQLLPAVPSSQTARSPRAILGLDFGTAFTKGVIQWEGRHHIVDWSDSVAAQDRNLMPSMFSEHTDGTVVLGARNGVGWVRCERIKMRLLLSTQNDDDERAQEDAVVFVAAAFRHAYEWCRCRFASVAVRAPRWRLHLGLPSASWDNDATATVFRKIADAARSLAHEDGPVSRLSARRLLNCSKSSSTAMVDVLPEFACQLYSYLFSAQRQRDVHALVDIGAGTLDVAFFNVHEHEGRDVLPIFSAAVEQLGTHYLIGALAGKAGESLEWKDADSSAADGDVSGFLNEQPSAVTSRRGAYLNGLAGAINKCRVAAYNVYPKSRAFTGTEPLRLFVCGGGASVLSVRERIEKMAFEAKKSLGITIDVISLPRPSELLGDIGPDQYHRFAVAFGLSHLAPEVGEVIRRHNVEPYSSPSAREMEDRDASR